jgi:hypothetical protein
MSKLSLTQVCESESIQWESSVAGIFFPTRGCLRMSAD